MTDICLVPSVQGDDEMHDILRCSTCRAIVPVGEEHFYDAGGAWPCPTCGAVIRHWVAVQVDLYDPFVCFRKKEPAQTQESASISAASPVSLTVT